jgi:hypothetical protein
MDGVSTRKRLVSWCFAFVTAVALAACASRVKLRAEPIPAQATQQNTAQKAGVQVASAAFSGPTFNRPDQCVRKGDRNCAARRLPQGQETRVIGTPDYGDEND